MPKNPTAQQPKEHVPDLTVVLSGENSVRASLRDGQLECPADFALRAYLAASLIRLAQTLTAMPAKGPR